MVQRLAMQFSINTEIKRMVQRLAMQFSINTVSKTEIFHYHISAFVQLFNKYHGL